MLTQVVEQSRRHILDMGDGNDGSCGDTIAKSHVDGCNGRWYLRIIGGRVRRSTRRTIDRRSRRVFEHCRHLELWIIPLRSAERTIIALPKSVVMMKAIELLRRDCGTIESAAVSCPGGSLDLHTIYCILYVSPLRAWSPFEQCVGMENPEKENFESRLKSDEMFGRF